MRVKPKVAMSYTLPYEYDNRQFSLYPLGDIHFGTIHCDIPLLEKTIKEIKENPQAYWVGMGDFSEVIGLSDPRFIAEEIDPKFYESLGVLPIAETCLAAEMLSPIADKCLGVIEGNHEFEYRRRHYIDLTQMLAEKLKVPYLDNPSMMRLLFTRDHHLTRLVVYIDHAGGGGRKNGGKLNGIEDRTVDYEADIYLRGHVHSKICSVRRSYELSKGSNVKIVPKERYYVLTGCYFEPQLRGGSYVSRRSLPVNGMGTPIIRIDAENGGINVEI